MELQCSLQKASQLSSRICLIEMFQVMISMMWLVRHKSSHIIKVIALETIESKENPRYLAWAILVQSPTMIYRNWVI